MQKSTKGIEENNSFAISLFLSSKDWYFLCFPFDSFVFIPFASYCIDPSVMLVIMLIFMHLLMNDPPLWV